MSITESAMLCAVHISVWSARKHDKQVSREVASQKGADERAGRYNKRLFCEAPKLDEIRSLAGRIRTAFYKVTLPWSDEGTRILPAKMYWEVTEMMREWKSEFDPAVQDFLAVYPEYVRTVRPMHGALFCEEDYPPVSELRDKFALELNISPLPVSGDFRVQLSEEHEARIAAEIDTRLRKTLHNGTQDLWGRLYEVVRHMSRRLSDPDARLYTTTVSNVEELASLLPKLNLTNDPHLNAIADEVKQNLCRYSANQLREYPSLRQKTADNASALADRITSAMSNAAASATEQDSQVEAKQQQVDDLLSRMMPYMPAA